MITHPIRVYRERAGITAETLGARVGLSKVSVSRIERGLQRPSPASAKAIHVETGIPLWQIRPDIWASPKGRVA